MSVGIRAEVPRAVVAHHAREDHARKRFVRHFEIWIALVVTQPHVKRGLMPLDEVRFENERFDFVGDDDRSHVDDALRHGRDTRRMRRTILKVRAHAIAQRDRFTDVENLVARPDHHVDAWRVGNLGERLLEGHLTRTGRRERRNNTTAMHAITATPSNTYAPRWSSGKTVSRCAPRALPRRTRPLQNASDP